MISREYKFIKIELLARYFNIRSSFPSGLAFTKKKKKKKNNTFSDD